MRGDFFVRHRVAQPDDTAADGLHVPKLAVLRFFQAASKAAMRQPVLESEQPNPECIGVFDREHNLTVTKRLQHVKPILKNERASSLSESALFS